jgi:preprotein translocase subunit SecE
MADDKPSKPRAKRLVKNPETFRERALKANEAEAKPGRTSAAKRATGKFASPAAKPLKKAGRVILPAYFRNSWQELKKVTWPDWTQSRKLTSAVLIFAILFGVMIAGVDWVLDKIFRNLILKT